MKGLLNRLFLLGQSIILKVAKEFISKSFSQNSTWTKPVFFYFQLEFLWWWAIFEFTKVLTCPWNMYSYIPLLGKKGRKRRNCKLGLCLEDVLRELNCTVSLQWHSATWKLFFKRIFKMATWHLTSENECVPFILGNGAVTKPKNRKLILPISISHQTHSWC